MLDNTFLHNIVSHWIIRFINSSHKMFLLSIFHTIIICKFGHLYGDQKKNFWRQIFGICKNYEVNYTAIWSQNNTKMTFLAIESLYQ